MKFALGQAVPRTEDRGSSPVVAVTSTTLCCRAWHTLACCARPMRTPASVSVSVLPLIQVPPKADVAG